MKLYGRNTSINVQKAAWVMGEAELNWEWIDDFFIKRPWNKIINFNNIHYLEIFSEKGILDETFWIKVLDPL